jgi:deoxyribonuclease V
MNCQAYRRRIKAFGLRIKPQLLKMKIPRPPHNWAVTPRQAIAIQNKLSKLVVCENTTAAYRFAAGADAAFSKDKKYCIGGVVLWDIVQQTILEQQVAVYPLRFPYIPGLLSFREAPAVIAALRKLTLTPDVLICDGQGIAHQRRFGIACHIGVLAGLPAVGCAKSRLIGRYREPGAERGEISPLLYKNKRIGSVVRTRAHVKPVFISVGHKLDLVTTEKIILGCSVGYRLPEPTRLADQLVGAEKRKR